MKKLYLIALTLMPLSTQTTPPPYLNPGIGGTTLPAIPVPEQVVAMPTDDQVKAAQTAINTLFQLYGLPEDLKSLIAQGLQFALKMQSPEMQAIDTIRKQKIADYIKTNPKASTKEFMQAIKAIRDSLMAKNSDLAQLHEEGKALKAEATSWVLAFIEAFANEPLTAQQLSEMNINVNIE